MTSSQSLNMSSTDSSPSQLQLINEDVRQFDRTLRLSTFIMVIMFVVSSVFWWMDDNDIHVANPLPEVIEVCAEGRGVDVLCVQNQSLTLPDSDALGDSVSITNMIGFGGLVVSFLASLLGMFFARPQPAFRDFIWKVGRHLLLGLVIAGFIWVVMEALAIMFGLVVQPDTLHSVSILVASLTASVIVTLIGAVVFPWHCDLNIRNMNTLAVIILVVSLFLSSVFTTNDWSEAFSHMGSEGVGLLVVGRTGSAGLFRFTFISLGIIFIAYGIELTRLYLNNTHVQQGNNLRTIGLSILVLSTVIGLCSIIVGVAPLDTETFLHLIGAWGAPIISIVLIAVLGYTYPSHASHQFRDNRPLVRIAAIASIVILVIAGILQRTGIISMLVTEFVFMTLILLFLQIFSTYFVEFLDEENM